EETGDETFAQRILGEGVAVEPSEGIFTAPVSGELTTVAGSKHAFGIKTDDGVEILVHIGIDTVQLNGKGFVTNLKVGDKVNKGDKLADADLNLIKEAGYKTITAVTVTNTKKLVKKAGANISPLTGKDVKAGDAIIRISR
ncbi:MAG: PTS glucose transporter subunit IIA, partial [Bifidobacteriaceae bacterium]|nr:PTS glucose transporter subunit IIA [Bifidobacteriaceae bacterium]